MSDTDRLIWFLFALFVSVFAMLTLIAYRLNDILKILEHWQ